MGENETINKTSKTEENISSNTPFKLFVSCKNLDLESITPISVYYKDELKFNEKYFVLSESLEKIENQSSINQYGINSIRFSTERYLDEFELIRSEIASLFNIFVPNSFKIYNVDKIPGVLTYLNLSRNTQLIRMSDYFSEINKIVQSGMFKSAYPEYNIASNCSGQAITDKEQVKIIINKAINTFPKDYINNQNEFETLKIQYIHMLLLDIIMGQKSRDGSTYYLARTVTQTDGTITNLIPGICSYDILNSNLKNEEYNLNDIIVDKNVLIDVLVNEYYKYIKKILSPLFAVTSRYKECISKIIYNNTNKEKAAFLEKIIFDNIDVLCSYSAKKTTDENKVELACTTTQLNLTIASKESEINEKYPINPRDIEEINEDEELQRVKILNEIEPSQDNKVSKLQNGYISAILVSCSVSFICGVGIGLLYILLKI